MESPIKVEKFDVNKHYGDICSWWVAEEWPIIPLTHLSENGFVAYANDVPAMAGWLYQTDSGFAMFEFIVANPKVRREDRSMSFEALTNCVKSLAAEWGFLSIYSNIRSVSLIERMKKVGFSEADKTTEMIFNIKGGQDG